MIRVTRLDGSELMVNCELVETVERTPDTVISLINHHKLVVRESVEEVVRRVMDYRRGVHQCPLLRERVPAALLERMPEQDVARRSH